MRNLLNLQANDGKRFRMSVWPVASHTRTPAGNEIIAAAIRQRGDCCRHPAPVIRIRAPVANSISIAPPSANPADVYQVPGSEPVRLVT